ncbi:MAG: carboxypeptidase-like regulatory domain-containing protein, partial [Tannerella sp.]|nr:carboxypeptidase-like regulatory domain-containing protein [Tannerella sp.]
MNKKLIFFRSSTLRRALCLLCIAMSFSLTALAQKQVTGTVTDADGEPVIGANIAEKGTNNGTITNADGQFRLTVKEGAVLRVSYIGYITQEIAVANRTTLTISLAEDTQALEEVIIIGYGTAKRKDFAGSVVTVRLEDSPVALAPNLNALESLKGNVAGLDIGVTNSAGGQPSMQLRGQKSISGSNDPLIVLDGMIYMG